MRARTSRSAASFVVGALVLTWTGAGARAESETPPDSSKVAEKYTAIALNLNPGPGRNSGRLEIRVKGWSSDERRAELLRVLAEKGSEALVDALRDEPEIGSFNLTGTLAYDLRYARATQQGETRHLVLATDRPVAMVELQRNLRSLEKGVTIIHLALGPDGKGTGELLVGAELALDPERNEITVEHLGINPIKLNEVEKK